MVRIMKKSGNRLEGIGERIDVRLTLLEEALGMTPGDPEIYGNWIASKSRNRFRQHHSGDHPRRRV